MVAEGTLDADFAATGGLPQEHVRHALASGKTILVPIPPEVVAKAGSAYVAGTIPAGSYDGQPAAVPTAVIMTLPVTSEAIIEDVVYLMTKSLFDHLDLSVQTHPAATTATAPRHSSIPAFFVLFDDMMLFPLVIVRSNRHRRRLQCR